MMIKKKHINVRRNDDTFIFYSLNHPKVVSDFICQMKIALTLGKKLFYLDFSNVKGVYPNAAVPICGIIDSLTQKGYAFEIKGANPQVSISNLVAPQLYDKSSVYIMNRIWKFDTHDSVANIVDSYIEEIRKEDRFGDGVLMSIQWSLNEVMDNIFVHSEAGCGYVMGQIHQSSKNIAFTVFDMGKGIYNSLRKSMHHPHSAIDAITLAIKEEITRDKSVGQGNGLFGLHSVVVQSNGILEITSGGACYEYKEGNPITHTKLPLWDENHPGTIIDFRLNYGNELSLENALVFRGKKYEITNLYVENLEDDRGNCIYDIAKHVEGTGTRDSALRAKNEIINILRESRKNIILNFSGISFISSSFADELIAKLLLELGLFQFNNVIRIVGLSFEQQKILQRSVIQRLIDSLNE